MTSDIERPAKGERLLLSADGFLFAAAFDIGVSALVLGGFALFRVDTASLGESLNPALGSLISLVVTGVVVFAGAMLAWRAHGRPFDGTSVIGMLFGVVIGAAIAMPVFVGGAWLMSRLPLPGDPNSPPWFGIGVLAVLVLAFVALPMLDAARDARPSRRRHVALDWMRVFALVFTVLMAAVLAMIGAAQGSEIGEAGIFMVPFAAAGAFAVLGADVLYRARQRREQAPGP